MGCSEQQHTKKGSFMVTDKNTKSIKENVLVDFKFDITDSGLCVLPSKE